MQSWRLPDDTRPTLERCRTASRAFSGTVAAYEWPTAYRATADNSVAIELAVEAVWRGAVPERVIVETHPLGGPGSCAIYPRPGEHFLICDGRDGAAQPAFSFCDGPSFAERADMLVRALGPSARPTAPSPPRWPWWTDRAQLAESEEALRGVEGSSRSYTWELP